MESSLRIVAITTALPGSLTPMVAEAPEQKPVLSAIPLKVETQDQAALKPLIQRRLPLPIT